MADKSAMPCCTTATAAQLNSRTEQQNTSANWLGRFSAYSKAPQPRFESKHTTTLAQCRCVKRFGLLVHETDQTNDSQAISVN